jgi:hypothetical protein
MSVDELQEYGLEKMSDEEIRGFLSSQGLGVLGLPTDDGPYMLPLAYDFDGDSRLYFTYLVGSESKKSALTQGSEHASFLVFSADSMFNWESVQLSGVVRQPRSGEAKEPPEGASRAWRPDLFQRADLSGGVEVYLFEIQEQSGIKHTGLPPAFERQSDATDFEN